ncbi:MAG: TIGR04076 family protein [Solobacterium sp.]|nr:TIGR04076 family protein [Solobacterium sp.]
MASQTENNHGTGEDYGSRTHIQRRSIPYIRCSRSGSLRAAHGRTGLCQRWLEQAGRPLCESAWQCMQHFVFTLSHGGGDFFKDWMKDKNKALISCNDGCRPVLFLVERMGQE